MHQSPTPNAAILFQTARFLTRLLTCLFGVHAAKKPRWSPLGFQKNEPVLFFRKGLMRAAREKPQRIVCGPGKIRGQANPHWTASAIVFGLALTFPAL